jgi:hypothetical protein
MNLPARIPVAHGLLPLCLVLLLAACGGGGGGGGGVTPPPPPPPPGNSITVSGQVTFDRPSYATNNTLNFSSLQRLPVRGATVEVLNASTQAILASTTSGATDGRYSASVPAGGNIIVRVKAQVQRAGAGGYDFEVRNNTASNSLYTLDSAAVSSAASTTVNLNAATGFTVGSGYTGTRAAAPFAILDMFWQAKLLLQGAESGLTLPPVDIYWSTLNRSGDCDGQPNPVSGEIGTSFYLSGTIPASGSCPAVPPGIYVLGDASPSINADTDEFDSSVIAHEFGHYYEDAFSRADSLGGPHRLDFRHDHTLAFSEGWGNAFQGFVLGSPWYRDTYRGDGSESFAFDMENNTAPFSTAVARGFYSEASVHEFLWDVFDPANDEQIDLGFGAIHTVMRNEMRTTDALTSIFVMADALETRHPTQQPAIRNRLAQEGIIGTGPFGAGQPAASGDPDNGPLYRVAVFGQPANVISTNVFGDSDAFWASWNRLGGRRYLRIDLPSGGGLRVVAQGPGPTSPGGTSDPDFVLLRRGVDQCPAGGACSGLDDSVADGREEATFSNLPAGTYVLEVAECSNLGQICRDDPPRGNTPITVTVTQQ